MVLSCSLTFYCNLSLIFAVWHQELQLQINLLDEDVRYSHESQHLPEITIHVNCERMTYPPFSANIRYPSDVQHHDSSIMSILQAFIPKRHTLIRVLPPVGLILLHRIELPE